MLFVIHQSDLQEVQVYGYMLYHRLFVTIVCYCVRAVFVKHWVSVTDHLYAASVMLILRCFFIRLYVTFVYAGSDVIGQHILCWRDNKLYFAHLTVTTLLRYYFL